MTLLFLGDVGGSELLLIGVVALVVLGPQRFPQIARKMGQLMGQFRQASVDLQRQLNNELRDVDGKAGGPSFGTQAAQWVSRLKSEVGASLVEKPASPPPAEVTDTRAAPTGALDVAATPSSSTPAAPTPPPAPESRPTAAAADEPSAPPDEASRG